MARQSKQAVKSAAVRPPLDAQPILNQRGKIIQPFGTLVFYQIGLEENVRKASVEALNQILADTIYIRDMYKKAHWQVSGPTFRELHLLFEEHYTMQAAITDMLAERVQILGGVSLAVPQDVAMMTKVERPPSGREQPPVQISRLLEAHEKIIVGARAAARLADRNDDLGTNDLLMADVLRPNEKQVWFLSEHLVDVPEVIAK
jgi:starvation-inducible DNA-binding protein